MKRKIQQWFICRYSLVSTGTPWNLKHYEYLCLYNSVLVSREQSPELADLGSQAGPHPGDGQNRIRSFWTRSSSNGILLQKAPTVSWGGRSGCWQIDTQQRSIFSIWWRLPAWGRGGASKRLRIASLNYWEAYDKPISGTRESSSFSFWINVEDCSYWDRGCDETEQNTRKPFLECKSSGLLPSCGVPVTQEREMRWSTTAPDELAHCLLESGPHTPVLTALSANPAGLRS